LRDFRKLIVSALTTPLHPLACRVFHTPLRTIMARRPRSMIETYIPLLTWRMMSHSVGSHRSVSRELYHNPRVGRRRDLSSWRSIREKCIPPCYSQVGYRSPRSFAALLKSWYSLMTSAEGPSARSSPFSIHSVRLHVSLIDRIEWETRKTVPAFSRIDRIRPSERSRNFLSPTLSASSTMRISCWTEVAIANFSRWDIPEEY